MASAEKDVSGFAKGSHLALAGLATGVVAGTAAIAAGFAASVTAAAGFEKTMSGVKAVSGATGDEMAGLSKLALQLGKDTTFSAAEAAAGIEELVKGGLSIADVMGGAAKSTLDLAAAGGVDLTEAAIIAANALAQFNLQGKDMAHVADLIAGAANASALDVSQFKLSLQQSGAVAATVGFSFDDLATAIAVMGKAGIAGADAGTSLKTMFLNLQPSTDKAIGLMKDLGIVTEAGGNQFFTAAGHVKSMAEVAEILQNATANLTEQQRIEALQTIFGTDAIRAAAVMAKAGGEGFAEMATQMGKVTAASVGAERLNNLTGSLEQLKGSLETAAIALGTAFLPVLRRLVDGITAFINAAIPWIQTHGPAMVRVFEDVVAAAQKVVIAFGAQGLAGAFDALGGKLGVLRPAWEKLTAALADFAPTGERIERLLDTIGRTIHDVALPMFEAIGRWAQLAGGEKGFWFNLAQAVNLYSASIEKMIDDTERFIRIIGPYVDWLVKVSNEYQRLTTFRPNLNLGGAAAGPLPGGVTTVPMRDAGGYGRAGQPYLIGTGAQPELFTPSSAGSFTPAGGYAGGVPLVATISIDGMQFATVSTMARQRYADRGGRPPPSWSG